MNPVFCYSDSASPNDLAVVDLWRQSWSSKGWDARVLSIVDAKRHPRYPEINRRVDTLPVDQRGPVRSSYRRWMALAVAGGGFLSDYDVINHDFAPIGFPEGFLTVYRGDGTPVLCSASATVANRFVDYLLGLDTVCTDKVGLARHERPANLSVQPVVRAFSEGWWATSPLVWYSDESVRKFGIQPKQECIKFVRPI